MNVEFFSAIGYKLKQKMSFLNTVCNEVFMKYLEEECMHYIQVQYIPVWPEATDTLHQYA
jgi:hypothetical protein